jgi:hypothetical protein
MLGVANFGEPTQLLANCRRRTLSFESTFQNINPVALFIVLQHDCKTLD